MLNIIIMCAILLIILCGCVNLTNIDFDNADRTPINPNASPNAKKLMSFLADNYGEKIISGQYINEYENFDADRFKEDSNDPDSPMTVFKANELQAVHSVTEQYPAILGLDMSEMKNPYGNFSVQQAIEWHNAGGIVTFCWHWKAPTEDSAQSHFYTDQTDFDLPNALKDPEGSGLYADIDYLSEKFKVLAELDIPVLWRPLHEASGGWFWWGAHGKKAYKELWDIVYERMTHHHGLNNLLWVNNAQKESWYVGDDKCDIISDDPYYSNNSRKSYEKDDCNESRFLNMHKTTTTKIIAMSENDFIPNIKTAFEKNARWSMFATWAREFVCVIDENQTEIDENGKEYATWARYTPVYSEKCATRAELRAAYDDDRVLTLEKLNELGGYLS